MREEEQENRPVYSTGESWHGADLEQDNIEIRARSRNQWNNLIKNGKDKGVERKHGKKA